MEFRIQQTKVAIQLPIPLICLAHSESKGTKNDLRCSGMLFATILISKKNCDSCGKTLFILGCGITSNRIDIVMKRVRHTQMLRTINRTMASNIIKTRPIIRLRTIHHLRLIIENRKVWTRSQFPLKSVRIRPRWHPVPPTKINTTMCTKRSKFRCRSQIARQTFPFYFIFLNVYTF